MSGLRPPELGPIIGHTTHHSCRIWIRGHEPRDEGIQLAADSRTVGILGLVDRRGRVIKDSDGSPAAYYFRLQREFDRTGTFDLGEEASLGKQANPYPLAADTVYRVRVATLALDDPMPDTESLSNQVLAERLPPLESMARLLEDLDPTLCEARFRTFPAPGTAAQELDFLLGSCRYPGFLWLVKEADRIYRPMAEHLRRRGGRAPARFTLMVGDQIYADTLSRYIPLGRADTYEEFQCRYHEAYGAPNMQHLLRSAPVYMILDDHEIEDNWSRDRLRENHYLFNVAISAYMSYQWNHGPRSYGRRLYYHFTCGGYPFFVLDTRTQRVRSMAPGLRDNHLLGRPTVDPMHRSQLDQLLRWLERQQHEHGNLPKFVVSSNVFAPNPIEERIDPDLLDSGRTDNAYALLFEANQRRRENSDSWPGYPVTRLRILEHIVAHNIQNVIFLSGDVHCANIARLEFETARGVSDLTAYNVTSSALYWPFPFADGDPNDFVHDSRAEGQYDGFPLPHNNATMHYRAWGFAQEDNFCRLEIDPRRHRLRVRTYDRDGEAVAVSNASGTATHVNELPLAPWS